MGISNATCFFSSLPIIAGQEVKLFIVKKNPHGEKHFFLEDFYRPYFCPLSVTLDNYTYPETITKDQNYFLLEKNILDEIKKDKIKGLNQTLSKDDSFEDILSLIFSGEIKSFDVLLVHKKFYDKANSYWDEMIKEEKYQKDSIKNIAESILSSVRLSSACKEEALKHMMALTAEMTLDQAKIDKSFFETFSSVSLDEKAFKKDLEQHIKFTRLVDLLRKSWFPPPGSGSLTILAKVHETVLKDAQKIAKEIDKLAK